MGFLARRLKELRDNLSNPSAPVLRVFMGGPQATSLTGKMINPDTALGSTAVYAAVQCISQSIARSPCFVYRDTADGGKIQAKDHPLYKLLHKQPNKRFTSFQFFEFVMTCLLLRGMAFGIIVRDNAANIQRIVPVHPDRMRVQLVQIKPLPEEPDLVFYYRPGSSPEEIPLFLGEVLYFCGLSIDGVTGVSPLRMMREAIGLSLAAEEFGARMFGSGGSPRGVLEHPGKMKTEGRESLRQQWEMLHSGLGNAHRVAILEEGMKFTPISIAPDDAQFLETRKFQVDEIARGYRLPPHKIGSLERSTNNNIEQQAIEYVQDCIVPWVERLEQAMMRDLLVGDEEDSITVEFKVDALLRGDTKSRYDAYAVGRQNGWLNANEIRRMENMEPIEGDQGEQYWQPSNMMVAGDGDDDQDDPGDNDTPNNSGVDAGAGSTSGTVDQEPDGQDSEQDDQKDGGRALQLGNMVNSKIRDLFTDALARCVRKETKAARRALEKVQKGGTLKDFDQWSAEFYGEYRQDLIDALAPAANVAAAVGGKQAEAGALVADYADRHIAQSKKDLATALASEVRATEKFVLIEAAINSWERRPQMVAEVFDELLKGD